MTRYSVVPSQARPGYDAFVVPGTDFLAEHQAAELLKRPVFFVGLYVTRGWLEPAVLDTPGPSGALVEGVTKSSVQGQLVWRNEAGFGRKLWRVMSWPFFYI